MDGIFTFKLGTGRRTKQQIEDRIDEVDSILDALINTAMTSVSNGSIIEYDIDTGQTTQRVKYSTMKDVIEAIKGYEFLRQTYVNKLTPRVKRAIDSKNFR
jgi:tetrahydromethanopterin S-methyltransferase subunit B